eukprot:TRINITY_DN52536_c0_g1_i1.p1 TRINITY_DN52536_c0_g1~~TRINITY_DN52536_c0_g1_i1.p1  ORF type:complete len:204 (-),score=19.10 TRINITY_DN52536_c0_g1_i1:662-1273(-)
MLSRCTKNLGSTNPYHFSQLAIQGIKHPTQCILFGPSIDPTTKGNTCCDVVYDVPAPTGGLAVLPHNSQTQFASFPTDMLELTWLQTHDQNWQPALKVEPLQVTVTTSTGEELNAWGWVVVPIGRSFAEGEGEPHPLEECRKECWTGPFLPGAAVDVHAGGEVLIGRLFMDIVERKIHNGEMQKFHARWGRGWRGLRAKGNQH